MTEEHDSKYFNHLLQKSSTKSQNHEASPFWIDSHVFGSKKESVLVKQNSNVAMSDDALNGEVSSTITSPSNLFCGVGENQLVVLGRKLCLASISVC